jgi:hypothetical protein
MSSPRRQTVVALIVYAVISIEFFGVYALPHLGRVCACSGVGDDPAEYMWFLAWWPHALLHGQNPFFTSALFAPNHLDLGAFGLIPGAGLVVAPVTLLFGPLVSYNLVALVSPILAALFAFLLCRYVSGSFLAALVGGYVFGFSAYMLGHMLGHLNLVLTFPIPAGVHLVLRLIDGRIGRRPFVALMAVDLAALIAFSTELALTFVLFGVFALALALAVVPARRDRIAAVIRPTLIAGAFAVLLAGPIIYYALKANLGGAFNGTGDMWGGDALGFLIPTQVTGLGSGSFGAVSATFTRHDLAESGIYLGIPLVLIVIRYLSTHWRLRPIRLVSIALAIMVVLLLGSHLHVDGKQTIALPWAVVDGLPLIKQVLPVRLGLYVYLGAAVVLAMWLARPRPRALGVTKWAVAGLSIAFVVPNLGSGLWHTTPPNPRFFTTTAYRRYLPRDVNVLALPFTSYGMLWQAETGMWFRLAGGNLGKLFPANYRNEPIVSSFYSPMIPVGPQISAEARALKGFVARHSIRAVIIDQSEAAQWPAVLARLGLTPIETGGVLFYRVPFAGAAGG